MPKHYPTPKYTRTEVNEAGKIFMDKQSSSKETKGALTIMNNWRASHYFPLNTFQMRLRSQAKKVSNESLVVQRIKRLASIKHKLDRFPDMKMSQIQDIAGCRAIMENMSQVDALVDIYKHGSRGIKHKLVKEQDYVSSPKPSGYRGVHLIYKYRSDKIQDYDDLKIEIQIRSIMQHAWATAVEIVGTFIRQSLKSSQGEKEWLEFFVLMGSAMAIAEGKPIIPGTSDNIKDLVPQIIRLANELDVESHLLAFRKSLQVIGEDLKLKNISFYLLVLDADKNQVTINPYTKTQLELASDDYMMIEQRMYDSGKDAVLVSAESLDALKLAYPNYYLDSNLFLRELRNLTSEGQLELF